MRWLAPWRSDLRLDRVSLIERLQFSRRGSTRMCCFGVVQKAQGSIVSKSMKPHTFICTNIIILFQSLDIHTVYTS